MEWVELRGGIRLNEAKEYLHSVQGIMVKIEVSMAELRRLRDEYTGLSAVRLDGDRIQTSQHNGEEDKVFRYFERASALEAQISSLEDKRDTALEMLTSLKNGKYIQVLYLKYFKFKTLQDIADIMEISFSTVCRYHRSALQSLSAHLLKTRRK